MDRLIKKQMYVVVYAVRYLIQQIDNQFFFQKFFVIFIVSEYAKQIARLHSSLSKAILKLKVIIFRVVQRRFGYIKKIYIYIFSYICEVQRHTHREELCIPSATAVAAR